MAKVTFRRVLHVLFRSKVTAMLPVGGGFMFLVGSFFFWPDIAPALGNDIAGDVGATLFLVGSILYLLTPLLDFADMSYSIKDLSGEAPAPSEKGMWERLYKAQMYRTQRANALLYAVSGICFVAGSCLFYPQMRAESTHGAWLYLMGCVVSFLGAFLAASTAYELKKTAEPVSYPPGVFTMPSLSDEDAQMISCALYMLGDLFYAVGSIFFFPLMYSKQVNGMATAFTGSVINMDTGDVVEIGHVAELPAVVLFILGSVIFVAGALIDLLALLRSNKREGGGASGGGLVDEASGLVKR